MDIEKIKKLFEERLAGKNGEDNHVKVIKYRCAV